MGRRSNAPQRRAQIVAGLKQAMAVRGYGGASIGQIARAAGLASGLVHYHFENKEAILLALLDALVASFEARESEHLNGTPWGDLFAFIDSLLAVGPDADPDAVRCWVQIGALALQRPAVSARYRSVVDAQTARLGERVERVLAAEGWGGDPAAMASVLMATIGGAFHLACTAPGVIPPGRAAPLVRHMVRGLLSGAWP